jgi:phosphate transport system ATP-binding protein
MTTSPAASDKGAQALLPGEIIRLRQLNLFYGSFHALKEVNGAFQQQTITALIGPSGCGKSTLLRVLNRMNDLLEGVKITGEVLIDGEDIYAPGTDLIGLRKKVGMVFQRPNPFPLSIYDNVVYGPRLHGRPARRELNDLLEHSLAAVQLWDEVKDRLKTPALALTEEQQQRLCIARLLAVEPEILLMDEPCSALDPLATLRIEELMRGLKRLYTIIIVTHNMQQAARVSDDTGFMYLGELVEFGETGQIFTRPKDARTEDYITGKYG